MRGSQVLWKPGLLSYDVAGNILSIGPSEDGGTDLFAYDGASRLRESRFFVQQRDPLDTALLVDGLETGDLSLWNRTQHWESSTSLGYVFDEHGNLLTEKRNNADFRTHATNGATNRLTTGASYDAAGNLTLYDSVTTTYDALNRVVKRQAFGATPLYFLYTADDERTVTYDPEPTHPVWLRFTLRDFDGKLIRKVNEVPGNQLVADEDVIFRGDQPLAKVGSADLLAGVHLSLDHLGSVRATTNGSGALVAKKKFYPFGEEATPFFEQAAIALKYTGHERDAYDPAATGDDRDYMHARFASPITARFLSVDPSLQAERALKDPQFWNRYAYSLGNPLAFVDPDGRTVVSALNTIASLKPEISAASKATGGIVTPLDISRVLFEENRNDFNWVRGNDRFATPPIGGAEMKNAIGRLLGVLGSTSRTLGVGEMSIRTATRLLGFAADSLTADQRAQVVVALENPKVAVFLVAAMLQELKSANPGVPMTAILTAYNTGSASGVASEVALRSGLYVQAINEILTTPSDSGDEVVRCNGGYHFKSQCQ